MNDWLKKNIASIKMYNSLRRRIKMYLKLPLMYIRKDSYLPPMFFARWNGEEWIRDGK